MYHQKQEGFSTLQVVASIAIAGVLTATAANILVPMFLQTELNAAYEELYMVTTAVREVKEYEGDYTNLTNFQYLTTNGYIQTANNRYTNGTNQNAYGASITAVKVASNLDATVTYTTDEDEQCENLEKRAVSIAGLTGTPACAASVLTVTVD